MNVDVIPERDWLAAYLGIASLRWATPWILLLTIDVCEKTCARKPSNLGFVD